MKDIFFVTLASPPHLESPCSPNDAPDWQTCASSTQEMSQLKIKWTCLLFNCEIFFHFEMNFYEMNV